MWKVLVALSCFVCVATAACFKSSSNIQNNNPTIIPRRSEVVYYHDCQDVLDNGERCSGVYTIKPDELPPFQVYCDMETDGGGWVVFQRRMDGTEDFYRGWADYVKGFGNLNGEMWLGLNKIYRLTENTAALRVDLEDFDGNERYANYTTFQVLDSSRKYQLSIGGYSGNAGDSLSYHNGMSFSTWDQDNDQWSDNCANRFQGAWWYHTCHHSNLNGRYLSGEHTSFADGVNWLAFKEYHYSLKISEMKLR